MRSGQNDLNSEIQMWQKIKDMVKIAQNTEKSEFSNSLNIYSKPLQICGQNPLTGFYRNGFCETGQNDHGTHTVCAEMTSEFLNFTKSQGNDLSTPRFSFPGLKKGNHWCLCAFRWK